MSLILIRGGRKSVYLESAHQNFTTALFVTIDAAGRKEKLKSSAVDAVIGLELGRKYNTRQKV